jgi:hypothetical protein
MSLIIDTSAPRTHWTLRAEHDGFPAYELYLMGERIYEHWPGDPPYGPFDLARLLPPLDVGPVVLEGDLDDEN